MTQMTVPPRPVVLVHGFAASFEMNWRRTGVADRLAATGRTVIPFDFPGHGTGAPTYDPADYNDLTAPLLAVLPDGQVDMIAYSMGAATALRLASKESQRIRRLVVAGIGDHLLRPRTFVDRAAAALESEHYDNADPQIGAFVRFADLAGNDRRALAACVRREEPALTVDALANVTCPVLIVVGADDSAGRPTQIGAALPDVEWELLPDTDHFSIVGSKQFVDATIEFIDRRVT